MAATWTVDASVFLNAFNPYEAGHVESQRFLSLVQERAAPIIVPTLLLPELAAAVSRGRGDAGLARQFADAVGRLPHLILVPVESILASQAAHVAAEHRLRGSDAIYAAVALRFGSTLVSLDQEHLSRMSQVLTVRSPAAALAEWE
ncbi:MAG: type II toxin-antitoxin system VapC family toxin [Anaerolineae bacterium]|nr:type II toxin-antitoxin system VapC family toxin [Anaerolineae bacterium]